MNRNKPGIKNILVLIILIGVIPFSYFHSSEIYTFYMKTYYEIFSGKNLEQLIQKGEEMYRNKDYSGLMEYLNSLATLYPDNKELKKLEGLTLIKLGQGRVGTDIILSIAKGKISPEKTLLETVNSLYELKDYKDIILIMKKNDPGENATLLHHYGISLAKVGNFKAALPALNRTLAQGSTDREVYRYTGMAYHKTDQTRRALPYLKRALAMDENDSETAGSLVDAYRKLGRYKDAEKILRRMKTKNFRSTTSP
jgi:pentatricopeptide repeat protein